MAAPAAPAIIIADDFTGACDTGVQLATPGAPCPVVVLGSGVRDGGQALRLARVHGAVICDTESRHLAREEAAGRTAVVAGAFRSGDRATVVYKKIDSTLRGNVGVELDALMRVFPERVAVVAPAFPAAGRVTARGRCLVHGVPVDETEFGSDRLSPVRSSRVADVLGRGRTVTECTAADARRIVSVAAPGSIVVVDAADESDLEEIGGAVAPRLAQTLLVGSAGLARALGPRLRTRQGERDRRRSGLIAERAPARAVLVVVGSLSERSRAQARSLVAAGHAGEEVLDPNDVRRQTDRVAAVLANGRDVVLRSAQPAGGQPAGGQPVEAACEVAVLLGRIVASAVETVPGIALVLTGGDTAIATMGALGADTFLVEREVAPGVPAGAVKVAGRGYAWPIPVVTKAGGFGENGVMIDAVAYLKEGPCSQ
jgi:D-threonate/D-erythronate kinase